MPPILPNSGPQASLFPTLTPQSSDGALGHSPTGGSSPSSLLTSSSRSSYQSSEPTSIDDEEPHGNLAIHNFLTGLRLDEIVTLARAPKNAQASIPEEDTFPASFINPLKAYIQYLFTTWGNVVRIFISREIRERFLDHLTSSTMTDIPIARSCCRSIPRLHHDYSVCLVDFVYIIYGLDVSISLRFVY